MAVGTGRRRSSLFPHLYHVACHLEAGLPLARAEQKLAEAERDPQHKARLRRAAEAWLILANQLIRAEAAKGPVGSLFSVDQDRSQLVGLVSVRDFGQ
jgi:hypothetical protein